MPLKVTHEPAELASEIPENCVFCAVPTRYWYVPFNAPCCRSCCRTYNRADVVAAMEQIAEESKRPTPVKPEPQRISRGNTGWRKARP